jgi:hypothetical protein
MDFVNPYTRWKIRRPSFGLILVDKCNVHASISTIHHFLRRRAKAKREMSKRQRSAHREEAESGITARAEEN